MKLKEITDILEEWAPKEIAWERDNVGLQVGSTDISAKNILLSLDLTDQVIDEALSKNCNLIITHHPLLFSPLKKIDIRNDRIAALSARLIKNDITLYSAHTNLDFTKGGVSFRLAEKLGLQKIDFLHNIKANQYKFTVFIPEENAEKIAEVIFNAGGGIIGNYNKCSFTSKGKGTFLGSGITKPAKGKPEEFVSVHEVKLEILTDKWKIGKILKSLSQIHPYEEIAYDLIPLYNPNVNYGYGAIGELEKSKSPEEFLDYISLKLGIKSFRYSEPPAKKIKIVSVCGGAGTDHLRDALSKKCDAFITGDLKYHTFQEAEGKILLIDAGHYETEIFSLEEIQNRLNKEIPQNYDIKVFRYSGSTNPVIFYNN